MPDGCLLPCIDQHRSGPQDQLELNILRQNLPLLQSTFVRLLTTDTCASL